MVYATWGRGSKSGGFVSNTLGTVDSSFTFEPERSENFEAGIKSTLFDGAVIANVSAYHTQFKNLQVSVYRPETSSYLTGNAASATSKGIEGSIRIFPFPNFDIRTERRRVGKDGDNTCKSRWWPFHKKQKKKDKLG